MNSKDILSNSNVKKPLVCALCKSEYITNAPITEKCQHELISSINSQRYNEILAKNFELTLAKIEQNTISLDKSISNSEQQILRYYDKIRQEINARVVSMIQEIESEKRQLFQVIDSNQKDCLKNYKDCELYRNDLVGFIKEADDFVNIWRHKSAGESVLDAFKKGYLFKIELERKKVHYESFIFNKKIEFHPDCGERLNVGCLIRIIDRLPKFSEWRRIDLKEKLFLSLKNGDRIMRPYLVIEEFESGNLFYCYVYQNPDIFGITKIKLVVSDCDGNFLRSVNEHTYASEFKVYKFRDRILVSLYSEVSRSNLKVYNEDLTRLSYIESLNHDKPLSNLFANENGIYLGYITTSNNKKDNKNNTENNSIIYAMNWDLEYINSTNPPNKMNFPFYFPNSIDQIEFYNSKFYLKYQNTITVIDEKTGEIMKVLDIPCASEVAIDQSGFFVIFCKSFNKVFYLNLNCDVLDENELIGFPSNLKFHYNKYERTIFFYDSSEYVLYKLSNEKKLFRNALNWYLKLKDDEIY